MGLACLLAWSLTHVNNNVKAVIEAVGRKWGRQSLDHNMKLKWAEGAFLPVAGIEGSATATTQSSRLMIKMILLESSTSQKVFGEPERQPHTVKAVLSPSVGSIFFLSL